MKFHVPLEENFRAQWRWVAKTGNPKDEWPGLKTIRGIATDLPEIASRFSCFCCAVRSELEDKDRCGDACPVKWSDSLYRNIPCTNGGSSLFREYTNAFDFTDRTKIAAQIAELPWRTK